MKNKRIGYLEAIVLFFNYSTTSISRTSKGSDKEFEKSEVREIEGGIELRYILLTQHNKQIEEVIQ